MNITRKFDRALKWAGEKMGGEARTHLNDDFKNLETEMALRYDGECLHRRRQSLTPSDFRLRILVKLLKESQDSLVLAVAAHDVGQYVKYYERGKT